jgi:hypothetical protein
MGRQPEGNRKRSKPTAGTILRLKKQSERGGKQKNNQTKSLKNQIRSIERLLKRPVSFVSMSYSPMVHILTYYSSERGPRAQIEAGVHSGRAETKGAMMCACMA